MTMTEIESLDDPRLAPYRNLKNRDLARDGGRFIAESEHVVRRLLASEFEVESVVVAKRLATEFSAIVPASVPLLVVSNELIHQVVGFKFHSGVIACARRKTNLTLDHILPPLGHRSLVVICPDLISHENLGSLVRISSAFGADAMILGPKCCDPFYRLGIRVSMGTVFSLPIMRSVDLQADLNELAKTWEYELAATVLSGEAETLDGIPQIRRIGLLFGNEAQGLSAEEMAMCRRRVTIPMKRGTDSLNVAVAAGIFLHYFSRE